MALTCIVDYNPSPFCFVAMENRAFCATRVAVAVFHNGQKHNPDLGHIAYGFNRIEEDTF